MTRDAPIRAFAGALPALLVIFACGRAQPAPTPAPATQDATPALAEPPAIDTAPAAADPKACAQAPGWRYERIELPPEFAPTLPAGVEELYFAPGMFERGADTYFTYVFSLAFTAPGDRALDADGLRALLDTYYQGLLGAVADARGIAEKVDAAAIRTRVAPPGDGFDATVPLVDAFVTEEPITLHMRLRVRERCVIAAVSPVPPDASGAATWRDLERALACVPCAGE